MSAPPLAGRLLLVGNPDPVHVGAHLYQGAQALELDVRLADSRRAYAAPRLLRAVLWRWDRRPATLRPFSRSIVEACEQHRPDWLLTTGIAPLERADLERIGAMGVRRLNFLTDDPWNPSHRAHWFLDALHHYDAIFSPRHALLDDLRRHSAASAVHYLPFGYNPTVHFPPDPEEARAMPTSDLLFAGGADPDRVPWMAAAIEAELDVALYGGYWERYRPTQPYAKGMADLPTLRQLVARARVNLCLVRRANRDGHVMRTFEIPAMGGCMLAEDSEEHRTLLGAEGEAVLYFATIPEMVEKARWLLDHPNERQRLARAAHQRITEDGRHRYQDRLEEMLEVSATLKKQEL